MTQLNRAEQSERRMVDAAIDLIVERGVTGTALTDVGLRAGYSRGLAAMRFGNKAALLRRVVEHLGARWVERLDMATHGLGGLSAVRAAIAAQSAALAESPGEMRALYSIFFQSAEPRAEYHADVARALSAQRRDMVKWFVEAAAADELRHEVDAEGSAGLMHCAMLGVVYQWMMDPGMPSVAMHGKLLATLDEGFGHSPATRRPLLAGRGPA